MSRTATFALVAAAAVALAACTQDGGRQLARYYDPAGMFSASLPLANDISVTPPQAPADGPGFLTGVVSSPPQPSPSPQGQLPNIGANFAQQSQLQDQTIYQAYVVTTDTFQDLSAMVLYFLTGDSAVDVLTDRSVELADLPATLVVADINREGPELASIAAAFSLGENGTGYIVAALFPQGGWDDERADFLKILGSFDTNVPPALDTYPLASGSA
jgi:hypothetical protein